MKKSACFFLFVLLLTASAQGQVARTGPHGGKVKATSGYNIEMLYSQGNFYAFLLDAQDKPISNKNLSCSLSVCFNTCDKSQHLLKPFSTEGFSADEALVKDFYSCTITFQYGDKTIAAEFYNEDDNGK